MESAKNKTSLLNRWQVSKKDMCFNLGGDKINEGQLQIGSELKIDFDIESRDFNGRWYTDIKAWKTVLASLGSQANPEVPDTKEIQKNEEDDLPF